MHPMTKDEALQFKTRWHMVNDLIAEEVRNTAPEIRLQQLRTMFSAAHFLSPDNKDDQEVRDRWCRLKNKLHV